MLNTPTLAMAASVAGIPMPMFILAMLAVVTMAASVITAVLHRTGKTQLTLAQTKKVMIILQVTAALMLVASFLGATIMNSNASFLVL